MTTTETRQHVHGMWNAVAQHWEANADYVDDKAADLSKAMLDAAAINASDRVLELACGTGGLGAQAAALAREVVISDVAPAMVEAAARRTAQLTNVSTRVLDIEEIAEPDASFDVVVCREGLMFAVEPAAALREIRRLLRPDGRFVAAVWGPEADNPWLGLVFDAVSEALGRPMPPPGLPGPFSLSNADRVRDLLDTAGFDHVAVDLHEVTTMASSFEEWWTRTSALAGPLANILPMLPTDKQDELVAGLRKATKPYISADGGLAFPGVSLLLRGVTRR